MCLMWRSPGGTQARRLHGLCPIIIWSGGVMDSQPASGARRRVGSCRYHRPGSCHLNSPHSSVNSNNFFEEHSPASPSSHKGADPLVLVESDNAPYGPHTVHHLIMNTNTSSTATSTIPQGRTLHVGTTPPGKAPSMIVNGHSPNMNGNAITASRPSGAVSGKKKSRLAM
jgi:hypothetical protein